MTASSLTQRLPRSPRSLERLRTRRSCRSVSLLPLALSVAAGILGEPASGMAQVAFEKHVISMSAEGAQSVYATDVDGDGDTDVLSASLADDKIAWYENDGGSPPGFTERIVSTMASGAQSVYAADVDGDGDTDVLSASFFDDKVAWHESDGGSPPAFVERVISTAARGPRSVFATDLDGDGDTDVLSAADRAGRVTWYENNGQTPPVFTDRIITTTASGAWSVFATDVDGDDDTDVLSASVNDDTIAWYENDGDSPPQFTERIISTTADAAFSVFATDVDGDGDTDALSASAIDDKIAWYENDGSLPPAFTERIVSTAADFAESVYATDVDGDGDIDVLSASIVDQKIAWYENDGGLPPTFTERIISTTANLARSVFATDVDGDGDTDVLSSSEADNEIVWYEQVLSLAVEGSCPGTVTVAISSAPPRSEVAVVAAENNSGFTKGGLLCSGTVFEVGEPFRLPPFWIVVDDSGRGSGDMALEANRCWLEAMALTSCETSGAIFVP